MLEAELDHELGYTKYDYKNKATDNSRNGYSTKTVKSDHEKLELNVPRNRNGDFEPQVVKKNQSDISSIEDQVLSMYAKGMTTCDIEKHLENLYAIDASPELILRITDRITLIIAEWQSRPLSPIYFTIKYVKMEE